MSRVPRKRWRNWANNWQNWKHNVSSSMKRIKRDVNSNRGDRVEQYRVPWASGVTRQKTWCLKRQVML